MSSGVAVDKEVLEKFQLLQMGENKAKKYRYLKCIIDEEPGLIIVDEFVEKSADQLDDYKKLTETLKDDKCAFVFLDMEMSKGDTKNDNIFFISWVPDTAKVKHRMVYASSKEALIKAVRVTVKPVQASDRSDLDYSNLCDVAAKK